jgi:hypothetical protein
MFTTILLAATLAQMGSSGSLYPSSSPDFGKLGTPMGGVIPGGDPGRDNKGPLSGSGGSTNSGGSNSSSSNGWSGSGGTTGTSSEATEPAGGGGTGTITTTRTAGGTSSSGTLR